ncbi:Transcription initiation factor [Mycena chlorophos]|uniref:Transcription initiation factor n=1 Tax=Mycena chlorophos TaxID=658473 RepID=A0A8H6RVR5_MYCCL|nr:Transcription initiation factor [Mycena chlorophos]
MAPQPKLATLFHPKKPKKDVAPAPRKPRPKPAATEPPAAGPAVQDDDFELPNVPFQEFKLMSSALNGWKYDVMKFDSRKPVDLTSWRGPIKLNRKDLRRDEGAGEQVAVGQMLGLDGKPVFGADGRVVMVDADGKPIAATDNNKGKQPAGPESTLCRTRVRQLRREERYPWVIEDATGSETWTAQLEDVSKSATHAFFMPAANNIFKFVPAHRWYKFQKKLVTKQALPTDTVKMESMYADSRKRDPGQWLFQRYGKGPSTETAAMFKAEEEGRALSGSSTLVHNATSSMAPGGRRLKAVDSGMNELFGDDDEDGGSKRRREKEYGGEGDMDEAVYEEEFADDDDKVALDGEDEEAKDIEERIKKEYVAANKQRDGHIDESDDEDTPGMSKQAKRMQKLIRSRENNEAYDSDEDKNPYASSEEEEDEEVPIQPLVIAPPVPPQPAADAQAPVAPGAVPPGQPNRPAGSSNGSRAGSPALPGGMNGHSLVAKRATSPKIPASRLNGGSRGSSPLASRATSPVGGRATSPGVNGIASPNGVPKKRKADDPAGSPSPTSPTGPNGPPKLKKRKTQNAPAVPGGELEDRMVVEWLKNTNEPTTRDCIQYFQPYLTDAEKKRKFTALIKEVAILRDGVLSLRPGKA